MSIDPFKGDDAALCDSIDALLGLSSAGALTPRVPNMAISLLTSAAIRLSAPALFPEGRSEQDQGGEAERLRGHHKHATENWARAEEELAAARLRIKVLEAERDEAREISRTLTRFYPDGDNHARDDALTRALCAVQSPSDRVLLSAQGETKPAEMLVDADWLARRVETEPDCDVEASPALRRGDPVGATAALAVTDEMVERGARAMMPETDPLHCLSPTGQAKCLATARRCLEAALAGPSVEELQALQDKTKPADQPIGEG